MAAPTSANYVFLPWVRQGAASAIQTPDSLGTSQAGVVSVPVVLRVNTADITRQVRLYGPGDVTGIDPQQVLRTEPRQGAADFEPNYFPAIEFDRPDFPWLFTPAQADASGRLRPWLCLVVARKQAGVTLRTGRDAVLPILDIKAPALPARELPDLSEAWAWAHAQVAGSPRDATSLKAALAGDPALNLARLLCPRRLDPATEYLACLVPTFELGRKAGLGLPIAPVEEQSLQPAWASGPQSPSQVTLPVYYHWEFRTGVGGDFEQLVRSLQPRELPDKTGRRRIDISQPGMNGALSLPPGTLLELEGALRALDAPAVTWPATTRGPFQSALREILNAPWLALQEPGHEPLVAPPIYGRWQAAQQTVQLAPAPPAPPPSPPWLHELNLDPRHRAVAALGTRVVQAQQEQLVASAWEQLGEIERINQLRRQAQLARAVNAVYHTRHFARFPNDTLLNIVASARSRVVVEAAAPDNTTTRMLLSRRITRSALPDRAVSAPLRRLASPRGAISARFQRAGAPPIAIVTWLNVSTPVVPSELPDAGLVSLDHVSDQSGAVGVPIRDAVRFAQVTTALDNAPTLGDFTVVPEGASRTLLDFRRGEPDNPDAQAFRDAAGAHQAYLVQQAFISFLTFPAPPMDLPDTRDALLASVDPEQAIKIRVLASLRAPGEVAPGGDPLEPILDAPSFPQPMVEAVRELAPDLVVPGLEHVLPNTVTLLETNAAFVESFLVGLNSELGSELLWRNYPTDQRATFFRQFWDAAQPDIEQITEWGDRQLGQNAVTGDQLVLLVRGDLLRRYPNSVIYAVPAVLEDGLLDLSRDPAAERHPLFRGTLDPDITYLGFNLKRADAMATPGWFFVIQQQPTEPRFGLDAADFDRPLPALASWNDLSWRHLADSPAALQALSHASASADLPGIDDVTWGRNAAHQATITLQRPVRIAVHARDIIPPASA